MRPTFPSVSTLRSSGPTASGTCPPTGVGCGGTTRRAPRPTTLAPANGWSTLRWEGSDWRRLGGGSRREVPGAGGCTTVNRDVVRVASYRFRATFAVRWRGYVALALLIGLVGGVAMGSIAAGRRTQSSYPRFLASTNPSDLNVSIFGTTNSPSAASSGLTSDIAHLAHVKR